MTDYLNKWQPVADDVLSVLLACPGRWIDAIDAGITSHDFPPGAWQAAYMTVMDLASAQTDDRPLMDTTVATSAGASVSVEWVAERIAAYDEWREGGFQAQLQALKQFGRGHRQLVTLHKGVSQLRAALNNGLQIDTPAQSVVDGLQAEQLANGGKTVSLIDLMGDNKARMEAEPIPRIDTGIWLLDDWTDGMAPNEFLAWVAPYKSRKTSVMANVVIRELRRGSQINIFSFDERRANFIYRLEALLMAEYLWHNHHWQHSLNNISAKILRMSGNKWKTWDKPIRDAFEYAFDTLSKFGEQCRIYDPAVCKATMPDIRAICRMDATRYGLDMVFVDHLQSLSGYRTIFDQVEQGSADLHLLRGELDCRMWVLSQQNEAAINAGHSGSWSPNVKGGGGLASKADTVVMSTYKQGTITDPRVMRLELKLARDEESQVYGYVEVHPASGWITPRRDVVSHYNLNELLNEAIGEPQ